MTQPWDNVPVVSPPRRAQPWDNVPVARRAPAPSAGSLGVGVRSNVGEGTSGRAPPRPTYTRQGNGLAARVGGAVDAAGQGAQDALYQGGRLVRFLPGGQIVAATQPLLDEAYNRLPRYTPNGEVERQSERAGGFAANAVAPGSTLTRAASVVVPMVTGAVGRALGDDTGEVIGDVIGGFLVPGGRQGAVEEAGARLRQRATAQGGLSVPHMTNELARLRAAGVDPALVDVGNANTRAVVGADFASRGATGTAQVNEFRNARIRNLPGRVVEATRANVSPTPVRAPAAVQTVPPGEAGAAISATVNTSRDAALRNVDRAYNVAREAGAERLLAPRTEIPVVRETLQQAVVNGWDEQTAPAVYREIESLTSRQDMTVEDLMRSRTRLTNLAADTANPVQASAARAARRALDAEITRLEPLVQNPSPSGPRTLTAGAPTPDSGADAIAAWRRAQRRRARFGRQYEGGDLLERLTAREVRGGENNVQVIPPEGASAAAIGSAAGTVRVDGNTARDLRRLRARLGPNSPEWQAFQNEATDRLMGTDPERYGERFADFETRYGSRGLVDLLVPPARQAELRAAQAEAAGRGILSQDGQAAIAAVPAADIGNARNAAGGVIERTAGSGNPRALVERMLTPEQHARNVALLGSEDAALAYEARLAAEGRLVDNAQEIRTLGTPQVADAGQDAITTAGAAAAVVPGLRHGMMFSQTRSWLTKFRINPDEADRITAAVLDPAQTDAILREVRRDYGARAARALRDITRRAQRNVGTAGVINGNAE